MTRHELRASGRRWHFSPVDPPRQAGLFRTVARAQIVDDLNLIPPVVDLVVTASASWLTGRAGPDGLVGVLGRPWPLLPQAQVAGTGISVRVAGRGYTPLNLNGMLGAQPLYPEAFRPLDFGTQRLQRLPVTIRGKVTRVAGLVEQPVSGATVAITAAQPVADLPGATPLPPNPAIFTALTTPTTSDGSYEFPPISRAVSLRITVSAGPVNAVRSVAPDYADRILFVNFRLP